MPKREIDAVKGIFEEYNLGDLNKNNFDKYFSVWPENFEKLKGSDYVALCNLNGIGFKFFSNYILNFEKLKGLYMKNNQLSDLPKELSLMNLANVEFRGNPLSLESKKLLQFMKLSGTNVF